jgi:dTDP-4-dehydrorhamnose reductase
MRVLILGATGMLGYSLFANLREVEGLAVFGTVRNIKGKEQFFQNCTSSLIQNTDVTKDAELERAIELTTPDIVLNCIGLIKQHNISKQHVEAIEINALLPHKIASLCDKHSAKLVHFSTDCVFSGKSGSYTEESLADAIDLYGKSKCLGEVDYEPHLTLRTSIIGHELNSTISLVDWFLSQKDEVKGFSKAIFSGLPTAYIAKLLVEKILPISELSGLFHLSVEPIDKYSLLNLISDEYCKDIIIKKDSDFVIDRSLNSRKLTERLDYQIPSWPDLIGFMHKDYMKRYKA